MATRRPRPFVDTNIVFSGLYGSGAPAIILDRHNEGRLTVVVSRQVLSEAADVMRRKQPRLLADLAAFLRDTPPDFAVDPTLEEVQAVAHCINWTDAPILAAAIKSGADCLVSGNTRHFTQAAAACAGIPILTPAAYVATLAL